MQLHPRISNRIGTSTFSECLKVLENLSPESESGYHGVYRHRSGVWYAKFFKRLIGGMESTPKAAALNLARFWHYWFGDHWPSYFRCRMNKAYKALQVEPGVWQVRVYLLGVPHWIGRRGKPDRFATDREARRALRKWMFDRYGLFLDWSGLEMRRLTIQSDRFTRPVHNRDNN